VSFNLSKRERGKVREENGGLPAATIFLCVSGTPFGTPVEPDVYMIQQISSGSGGTGFVGLLSPKFLSLSKLRIMTSLCAFFNASISDDLFRVYCCRR
jgi:hypothetical protein